MSETRLSPFIHNKDYESNKNLLYIYYRTAQPHSPIQQLIFLTDLANFPTLTSTEFGIKLVIALTFTTPSVFFNTCKDNGQLKQFFPELYKAIECSQDPQFHTLSVYDHTLYALDSCELMGIDDYHTKLAILFHDLGKINTKKEIEIE